MDDFPSTTARVYFITFSAVVTVDVPTGAKASPYQCGAHQPFSLRGVRVSSGIWSAFVTKVVFVMLSGVKGQEFLPTGGHEICPLVAFRSAR